MDEYTADAFANRDEAIPVLSASINGSESLQEDGDEDTGSGKRAFRQLKESLRDRSGEKAEKPDNASRFSIQERLLAK